MNARERRRGRSLLEETEASAASLTLRPSQATSPLLRAHGLTSPPAAPAAFLPSAMRTPSEKKHSNANMEATETGTLCADEAVSQEPASVTELDDVQSPSEDGGLCETTAQTAALEEEEEECEPRELATEGETGGPSDGVRFAGDATRTGEARSSGEGETQGHVDLKPASASRFHSYAEQDVCAWATSMLARNELRKLKAAALKLEGDRMPRSDVVGLYFKKHRPCWSVDYHTRQGKRKTVEFFVPDLSRETIELVLVHAIECRKYMPRRFDQAPAFVPEPDDTTSGMPYRYGARLLSPEVLAWVRENNNSGRNSQHAHGQSSRRGEGEKAGSENGLPSCPAEGTSLRGPRGNLARQRDSRWQAKGAGGRAGSGLASSEEKAPQDSEAGSSAGGLPRPGGVSAYVDCSARHVPGGDYPSPAHLPPGRIPGPLSGPQMFDQGPGMHVAVWREEPREAPPQALPPTFAVPHATSFSPAAGFHDRREAAVESHGDLYTMRQYPPPYPYGPVSPEAAAPAVSTFRHPPFANGSGYVNGRAPCAPPEAHRPQSPFWGPHTGIPGEDKDCQVIGCTAPTGSPAPGRMASFVGSGTAFEGEGRHQGEAPTTQAEQTAKRRRVQGDSEGAGRAGPEAPGSDSPFVGPPMCLPAPREWPRNGQAFAQPGTGPGACPGAGLAPGTEDARRSLHLSASYSSASFSSAEFPSVPPQTPHAACVLSDGDASRSQVSGAASVGCASPLSPPFRGEDASAWASRELFGSPEAFPEKPGPFVPGSALPRRQSVAISDAGLTTASTASPYQHSCCNSTVASCSPKSASPMSQSGSFPCDFQQVPRTRFSIPGVQTPDDVAVGCLSNPGETPAQRAGTEGTLKPGEAGPLTQPPGWQQDASTPGAEFYAPRPFGNAAPSHSVSPRPAWPYGTDLGEGDFSSPRGQAPLPGGCPSSPVWGGGRGVWSRFEERQLLCPVDASDGVGERNACMGSNLHESCGVQEATLDGSRVGRSESPVGPAGAATGGPGDRKRLGEPGSWGAGDRGVGEDAPRKDHLQDHLMYVSGNRELACLEDSAVLLSSPLNEGVHPLEKTSSGAFPDLTAWVGSPPHDGSFVQEFDMFREHGDPAGDDALALWSSGGAFGQRTDPLSRDDEREREFWKSQQTPFCGPPAFWCIFPVGYTREYDVMDMVTLRDLSNVDTLVSRPLQGPPPYGGCAAGNAEESRGTAFHGGDGAALSAASKKGYECRAEAPADAATGKVEVKHGGGRRKHVEEGSQRSGREKKLVEGAGNRLQTAW
nr:TPA: AP2 domain transcription factor AP2IV-2 [Neospora caninum Liverpool]